MPTVFFSVAVPSYGCQVLFVPVDDYVGDHYRARCTPREPRPMHVDAAKRQSECSCTLKLIKDDRTSCGHDN